MRIFLLKLVYYQFFQILSNMINASKRQPHHKLTAIPSTSLSPKNKHDKSSIFFNKNPNFLGPSYNRPPTAQLKIERPSNVFIRRVKTNSNRIIKSKTDHSGHKDVKQRGNEQRYYIKQHLPIKSQNIHRVNSVKSFVIRKKNPSCGKRTNSILINCQLEFQSLQKNLMQQIDHNSRQLERKFETIKKIDAPLQIVHANQVKLTLDDQAKPKMCQKLENTLVSQINQKRNTLQLLQTKKSNHFGRNSRLNQQSNEDKVQRNHPQTTSKQMSKQNYEHFPSKCLRFDTQSSTLSRNCSKFLRKQDKHKSNKQFDRKQRPNSACRTIRVPWTQIQTTQKQPQYQKLKKTRAHFHSPNELTQTQKIAKFFGGISIIPNNQMKDSINCAVSNESLKNLCDELYIKGS